MQITDVTPVNKARENVGRHVLDYLDSILKAPLSELDNLDTDCTIEQAIKLWVRLSLIKTRSRPEIPLSTILNHIIPIIGQLPLKGIKRIELNRPFNYLLDVDKKMEAKRTFALSKQFLRWCVSQGYIEHSPLENMERRDVGGRNPDPLTRVLSDAEIWVFWHGLDMWDYSEQTRWALRLALLAARRPDEIVRAKREEFNLATGYWHQGKRNKSRREHTLPLSPLMRRCIEQLDIANIWDSPWLVPSPVDPSRPMSKGAVTQAVRRMVRSPDFGLEPFTTRDLRRTARTTLARLGVPNEVSRRIMNHAAEGMDRVYDKHDYVSQMRDALNLYSKHIDNIIHSDTWEELAHRYEGVPLQLPKESILWQNK